MSLGLTPSQTVGPFFSHALPWEDGQYVVPEGTPGAVRIAGRVLRTPLVPLAPLGLVAKCESLQHGGSFKLRGATNKILALSSKQKSAGVVAASNGNHGLAVAKAARKAGMPAEVFVSQLVSPGKAQRIQRLGAVIRCFGVHPLEAEVAARAAAEKSDKVFISPYNDVDVMAGQGTIAIELLEQLGKLDAVFVAVGGGGLIGGIGAYLKSASRQTEVVGCWPQNSPVLYESIKAGKIRDDVEEWPTLSESTSGGLEPDSVTLDVCRAVIDRCVLVSEHEILAAMRLLRDKKGWMVEGAAGVAVAGFIKDAQRYRGKTVAAIICGGNLSEKVRARLEEK
jgi:threonine dehydratase